MPIEMQPYFLRVLESGQDHARRRRDGEIDVDVRVIAATNRDPMEAVRAQKLREDLFFRLRVVPIEMPPLRARGDDVRLLAQSFLDDLNERHGTRKRFDDGTLDRFAAYAWPGNVRELKHAVHHAYIVADRRRTGVVFAPEQFDAPWSDRQPRACRWADRSETSNATSFMSLSIIAVATSARRRRCSACRSRRCTTGSTSTRPSRKRSDTANIAASCRLYTECRFCVGGVLSDVG